MLIAGLGNIGSQYTYTRHNFGFMVADAFLLFCEKKGLRIDLLTSRKFKGTCYKVLNNGRIFGSVQQIYIAKPETLMNLSGLCVQPFMAWYDILPDQLLVLHDELDIPFGDIRLKYGGGLAGHNGLKSISEQLGTQDFHRLRLGIDKPEHKGQIHSYVLSAFNSEEKEQLPLILDQAVAKIQECIEKQ